MGSFSGIGSSIVWVSSEFCCSLLNTLINHTNGFSKGIGFLIMHTLPCEAITPFQRTKRPEKALASFRKSQGVIHEIHKKIWPGIEIVELQHKSSQQCSLEQQQQQGVWFAEKTMTTSIFTSFMVFSVHGKFRCLIDRAHSCLAFRRFVHVLANALGGFELDHIPLGSNGLAKLTIDADGLVDPQLFWELDFYVRYVRKTWRQDFDNEKKTWIDTSHGRRAKIHLGELLCFCLDPQHSREFQDLVLPTIFSLLSAFAKLLDESVPKLQKDMVAVSATVVAFKNKKRTADMVKGVWVKTIACKLWDGEDPWRLLLLTPRFYF